ncbi:hypothetical protein BVI434_1430017 [Burkholderia vietnamiensis]|nr:hypothetical protein BVI434_1430017 [Burkholderia vietnamiensis]
MCIYQLLSFFFFFFFFNDTATTEIYTLSLHDALPIWRARPTRPRFTARRACLPAAPIIDTLKEEFSACRSCSPHLLPI